MSDLSIYFTELFLLFIDRKQSVQKTTYFGNNMDPTSSLLQSYHSKVVKNKQT